MLYMPLLVLPYPIFCYSIGWKRKACPVHYEVAADSRGRGAGVIPKAIALALFCYHKRNGIPDPNVDQARNHSTEEQWNERRHALKVPFTDLGKTSLRLQGTGVHTNLDALGTGRIRTDWGEKQKQMAP